MSDDEQSQKLIQLVGVASVLAGLGLPRVACWFAIVAAAGEVARALYLAVSATVLDLRQLREERRPG